MQCCRLNAPFAQLCHLILHQCNERCDDKTRPFHGEGRHLKRDALAAARRHEAQRVPSLADALDDVELNATERRVTPVLFQYVRVTCHVHINAKVVQGE